MWFSKSISLFFFCEIVCKSSSHIGRIVLPEANYKRQLLCYTYSISIYILFVSEVLWLVCLTTGYLIKYYNFKLLYKLNLKKDINKTDYVCKWFFLHKYNITILLNIDTFLTVVLECERICCIKKQSNLQQKQQRNSYKTPNNLF